MKKNQNLIYVASYRGLKIHISSSVDEEFGDPSSSIDRSTMKRRPPFLYI